MTQTHTLEHVWPGGLPYRSAGLFSAIGQTNFCKFAQDNW